MRDLGDLEMRLAAAGTLARLARIYRDAVPWHEMVKGFPFRGGRIRFANQAGGIFKPKQMDRVLSIKSVVPRGGRGRQYSDQGTDGRGTGMWVYDMRDLDSTHYQNQWLKTAWMEGLPLIYLYGLAPAVYLPQFPVYVMDWDAGAGQVRLVLGLDCTAAQDLLPADVFEGLLAAYAGRRMEDRVSKARFRIDVLEAYRETCTFSGLSQSRLVDAVPIVSDANGGTMDVAEGLCMSRFHHAAFDANLLGIDPDGRIHVSEQLDTREARDPFVRNLMSLAGNRIGVPRASKFQPSRDLLAVRFEQFQTG